MDKLWMAQMELSNQKPQEDIPRALTKIVSNKPKPSLMNRLLSKLQRKKSV